MIRSCAYFTQEGSTKVQEFWKDRETERQRDRETQRQRDRGLSPSLPRLPQACPGFPKLLQARPVRYLCVQCVTSALLSALLSALPSALPLSIMGVVKTKALRNERDL